MNDLVTSLYRADTAESPAAGWTPLGRLAAAATLALGAGFQLAAFITEPRSDNTVDRLEWVVANPDRADLAKTFDVLAMPFLIGTAVVYVLLSRRRSPRLAWVGGILLGMGLVGLSTIQGYESLMFGLAQDDRFDVATLGEAIDDLSSPPLIAMLVMFLSGAFFGLVLSSASLWRSQAVPRGAVILILLFIVVDIVLGQGLAGHVISFIAAVWIGITVLRSGRT